MAGSKFLIHNAKPVSNYVQCAEDLCRCSLGGGSFSARTLDCYVARADLICSALLIFHSGP